MCVLIKLILLQLVERMCKYYMFYFVNETVVVVVVEDDLFIVSPVKYTSVLMFIINMYTMKYVFFIIELITFCTLVVIEFVVICLLNNII